MSGIDSFLHPKTGPPAPLVPIAGNCISFPTDPDPLNQYTVSWAQNQSFRSAIYYKVRCWFGHFDNTNKVFFPYGETSIFIAAEYLEPRYKGPVTKDKHMLSIEATQREEGWVTLFLNHRFEYGQDKPVGTTKRWIVFHPPIAKEPPRVIHQHRFGENFLVNAGDQIFKLGLQSSDAKAKIAAQILKGVTDLVKIGVGDSLRQFGTGVAKEDFAARGAQRQDYENMKDFNLPANRRDAFEAEPPSEGLTWDEIQQAREIADCLFDEHEKGSAGKKKPGFLDRFKGGSGGNKGSTNKGAYNKFEDVMTEPKTTKLDATNRTPMAARESLVSTSAGKR